MSKKQTATAAKTKAQQVSLTPKKVTVAVSKTGSHIPPSPKNSSQAAAAAAAHPNSTTSTRPPSSLTINKSTPKKPVAPQAKQQSGTPANSKQNSIVSKSSNVTPTPISTQNVPPPLTNVNSPSLNNNVSNNNTSESANILSINSMTAMMFSPVSSPESCLLVSPHTTSSIPSDNIPFSSDISTLSSEITVQRAENSTPVEGGGEKAAGASALNIPLSSLEDDAPPDKPTLSSSTSTFSGSSLNTSSSCPLHDNFLRGIKPKVEDFEFIQTIGSGMFGQVRLAKHKGTGETCAVKVLSKERVWRLGAVQNLRQEKDILFQVRHPRIVNMYATMQDEENVYLIMEFVTGGEMFTHLRQSEFFDVPTTRYYVAQLVTAIAKLHELGIAYRDIKPENIMLDCRGQLKLTDFGFAKKIEDLSFSSCGTPEYLAPEQILSQGHDRSVDWWAVGILTYEMLESQPPFFGDSVADIYQMALKYSPCFLTIVDPTAKSFIKSLLHKDKTKRLGCGVEGAKEVMNHPFFAGVDWKRIEQGLDKAPIQVDEQPLKNFVTAEKENEEEEEEEELPVTNSGPIDQSQFIPYF